MGGTRHEDGYQVNIDLLSVADIWLIGGCTVCDGL
jgi:hypothetical protein